jgi:hypothetical protein
MDRAELAFAFAGLAALLLAASFLLFAAYAGPEPFFEHRRVDAILFVGGICAAIALWAAWTLCVVVAVLRRVFGFRALFALVVPAIAVFYLYQGVAGYLDDLEQFMLSPTTACGG